jgi:hypothetical protein
MRQQRGTAPRVWDGAEIITGELFNYYRSKSDIALATFLRQKKPPIEGGL